MRPTTAIVGLLAVCVATTGSSAAADSSRSDGCALIELIEPVFTGGIFLGGPVPLHAGEVVSAVATIADASATHLDLIVNETVDSQTFVNGTATVSYTIPADGSYSIGALTQPAGLVFSLIDLRCLVPDADADDDGVVDDDDACPNTVLPDVFPEPKPNRFIANLRGEFVDAAGGASGYTIVDTGGCSATQIIATLGLGSGHARYGITRGALADWVASPT